MLQAEQLLKGSTKSGATVGVEYMLAWYLDWDYRIENRGAPIAEVGEAL